MDLYDEIQGALISWTGIIFEESLCLDEKCVFLQQFSWQVFVLDIIFNC